jgi:hypothetical protein
MVINMYLKVSVKYEVILRQAQDDTLSVMVSLPVGRQACRTITQEKRMIFSGQ